MKIIFAGRDNRFNQRLILELAQEHEICCCLWLEQERGFVPADTSARTPGLYSWMTLSAFIRHYRQRRQKNN